MKSIKINLSHWFDFCESKKCSFNCQQIKWDDHKFINLKKLFPKLCYSNYCFDNGIGIRDLNIMTTKIEHMKKHFGEIEESIYEFNFKKIYIEEHIDIIKFVHLYMVISNDEKKLDFDELLAQDETNFLLEQFQLTYENNKCTPGAIRIFHLFKGDGENFILYPLFIDFNHNVCVKKNYIKYENED